jgi:hypothetical protein
VQQIMEHAVGAVMMCVTSLHMPGQLLLLHQMLFLPAGQLCQLHLHQQGRHAVVAVMMCAKLIFLLPSQTAAAAAPLQVSFANSICTSKGGTHVNYVVDQITK